jgi:predicted nucleic acid-binding protein
VIHLDTNVLIGLADADDTVVHAIGKWLDAGESFAVSAIAWFEFSCGPLDGESLGLIEYVIAGRVVRFTATQAVRAATLFNHSGRQRTSRWDCMIAAAAIENRARLATLNNADFSRFRAHGLELAAIS